MEYSKRKDQEYGTKPDQEDQIVPPGSGKTHKSIMYGPSKQDEGKGRAVVSKQGKCTRST